MRLTVTLLHFIILKYRVLENANEMLKCCRGIFGQKGVSEIFLVLELDEKWREAMSGSIKEETDM